MKCSIALSKVQEVKTVIPVIVIFAPTACGKTHLACTLFGKTSVSPFKGRAELVSADSQAVYRSLSIGTAKPSLAEQEALPHHLIDIVDVDQPFGVGDFISKADVACKDIFLRKKMPLVVGGSGFYIRNFLCGLPQTPESSPQVRASLQERLFQEGKEALYKELQHCDPVSAKKIHPNDAYRVLRALEVFYTAGKPLSAYTVQSHFRKGYDFFVIILTRTRKSLYARIDSRVEEMFSLGLPAEVMALKTLGLAKEKDALKAIGYREFFLPEHSGWETNETIREAVKAQIKHNSHRYAKKQYTYMQGLPEAHFLDADSPTIEKDALSLIHPFFTAHFDKVE